MQCVEPPTETSHAAVMANAMAMKYALTYFNYMKIMAFLNPYSGSAPNCSSHDYIIAGGGTSGCVIANRLSEDPNVNVLLIEAGANVPFESGMGKTMLYTQKTSFTWNYTLAGGKDGKQKNNYITTAGKVLGGTSSINFMVHSQGFDFDYDEWHKITKEPSWCFSNIQRLLKKVERFNDKEIANSSDSKYHGFDGNVGFYKDHSPVLDKYFKVHKQAGNKVVADINNDNKLGFSGTSFLVDKIRQNSAYAYLFPIKNRTNLVVLKDTLVSKVILDQHNRAIGVEAIATKTNTTYTYYAKREVIVAAGAFNTPKILQLSGIGPRKLLNKLGKEVKANLPVGCNFHNHYITPIVFTMQNISLSLNHEGLHPVLFPSESFDGYANPNKCETRPVYRALSYIVPFTPATIMLQYTSEYFGYDPDVVEYWYEKVKGRETVFTQIQDLHPKSRGLVEIQSLNPFDDPLIKGQHYSKEIDLKNAVKYVKHYLKSYLETDYMKECGGFFVDPMKKKCGAYPYGCDEYWKCYVRNLMMPFADQCGTAAMGSVVDGRLRVYGVKGLRVGDASVMPTIVSGSATVPTIVIGENLSDMIKEDWQHMSNQCQ